MVKFEDFGLSASLVGAIHRLGFSEPTEIQDRSIPLILDGKDIIAESATGSGKTLAFGGGILDRVILGKGLQALVITPTRELAEQVKESLASISSLRVASVYGGVAINPQISDLRKAEVVVATPGRLLDHLQRKTIDLSCIKFLILDEADRMFDMGFREDIERIIKSCSRKRQTLLFSATISSQVRGLAKRYMNDPVEVFAKKHVDPSKLTQIYYNVPQNMKLSLLVHFLCHEKSGLVMVFCNTRRTVDFVVKNLSVNKIHVEAIHGGFSQNKRSKTIASFNQAKVNVLVCTDVAARGLHIDNVTHIYNFEIPRDPNDYVHRIGRTARAGKDGRVVNILAQEDYDSFSKIKSEYRNFSIEKMQVPSVEKVVVTKDIPSQGFSRFKKRPFSSRSQGFSRFKKRPFHRKRGSK